MDRLGSAAPAAPVEFEAEPEGWDAYSVWQTRVHEPRRTAPSPRPRARSAAEPGDGWDPLQTWQLRVRRSRGESR